MRAVVIQPDSHPNMKFEIFERLNTGAVVLNAQELRNSLYRGPFNQLLRALASDDKFRKCIGTKHPRKRMVDEELILRFFALRDQLSDYRPPLKRFLNDYMREVREANPEALSILRGRFNRTINRVYSVFDGSAFRVTDRRGHPLEPTVNRALFDAQMLVFSWVPSTSDVLGPRQEIVRRLADLYRNEVFADAIQRATGDRARTLLRVRGVADAVRKAGVRLRAPAVVR